MSNIWIAISNTPHVIFFKPLIKHLEKNHSIYTTYTARGETEDLLRELDIKSYRLSTLGSDNKPNLFNSTLGFLRLIKNLKEFDTVLSLENVVFVVPMSKLRDKKIVLFLDNDLKYHIEGSYIQDLRNKISTFAGNIVVPEVTRSNFSKIYKKSNMMTYDGYKEHIHISDYEPEVGFLNKIPFDEYAVLRPESLVSFYVEEKKTITPQLIKKLNQENINIVFLPRSSEEKAFAKNFDNVYVPPHPLNGIDLTLNARAMLTGSGTMAREAAVLGTPAVSFFPGKRLLAVDQDLVNKKKMLHSRDPDEIVDYVISNWNKQRKPEFERANKVKKEVIDIIDKVMQEKQ